ncbi:MAG TPA: hypothetical protein DHV16_07565 [Nitrospiraceae bacterium]|nr:MAG: hypothetical protein A2Z82_00590 [Nitrospirae bacterium GWA2_46_11]OGW24745.1 MAG: hypothetical protein A2X55_06965 [Nitrospirae bacterium GWB2_47_37]HAK88649.1 hypothetical protein [Nitrospiraceae bacterium]HCZ12095.1 hypothetical protein [Nitrospiraceae bacterium]
MDNRHYNLKNLLTGYIAASILLIIVVSGIIVAKKYGDSVFATRKSLQTAKQNVFGMKEAIGDIDKTIAEAKMIMPDIFDKKTAEELIYIRIDELKSRFRDAEVSITNIEYKGNEIGMPVGIKANKMKDYTAFVNNIGWLQSLKFPFFSISSIAVFQSQDKTAVSYEIKGALRTLKDSKSYKD